MSQYITVETQGRSFQTYVAFLDVLPAPTIVVIGNLWGQCGYPSI
jgi:hypothetical protein